MSPDEMLDYALGVVDDPRREQLDHELAADPALADRFDRLRRGLDRLLDDGQDFDPPADLAARTLHRVATHRPRRAILEYVPHAVPFRWADLAVAASIFLAGLITLLPAVHRSRHQMNQAGCTANLMQLGRSLAHYSQSHGQYPYPARDCPIPYAGLFQVMLHDAKLVDDLSVFDCPCNGHAQRKASLPSFARLCELNRSAPDTVHHALCGDYAYNLGYLRPSGQPGPVLEKASTVTAVLSDAPRHEGLRILEGNSPNHGGIGQNVLFSDGHVGWRTTRRLGAEDHDLFLNDERKAEPGTHPRDAVLAPGCIPFFQRSGK